ncbi:S-layer protein (plasmid) [Caballeronia sp. NK8]|uniref:M60 family metallopeptidase n=1 Tax=Caballeronia sp. NK8 TaxID=140098 RepID=UPI001BB605F7|nr:M60 family metallopeptidase [Caballeronia sp. NK8]BCQ27923.1 S-layer protein [Caballeronia sp. NK8]
MRWRSWLLILALSDAHAASRYYAPVTFYPHDAVRISRFASTPGAMQVPYGAGAKVEEGEFYIVSNASFKLLTAQVQRDGTIALVQAKWTPELAASQIWTVDKEGSGFRLYSKLFGRYLTLGARVGLEAASGEARQNWSIEADANAVTIAATGTKTGLAIEHHALRDGAFIEVNAQAGQWRLYKVGNETADHAYRTLDAGARSTYDNVAKRYHLNAFAPDAIEADRLGGFRWTDYHPSGLYVSKGESVVIDVTGLSDDGPDGLVVMIGNKNGFYKRQPAGDPQMILATEGRNAFVASRDGLLYFEYVDSGFNERPRQSIDVSVREGGRPVPFYIEGVTTAVEWRAMLQRYADAPLIEMVGRRTMFTVARAMYDKAGAADPATLLGYVERIMGYHDEVSGLDGSSALDMPSPLRVHFMQDAISTHAELQSAYMYATYYMIGLPMNSAAETVLKVPKADQWGVWHELGHMYQQWDWTWPGVTETTVNIYSLHALQRLGAPMMSPLLQVVDARGRKNRLELAGQYLAQPSRNFLDDASFPVPSEALWIRLVMYEQLRRALGDGFYARLHKLYRRQPLTEGEGGDRSEVQTFVLRACVAANFDLTDFFSRWGLPVDAATRAAVGRARLKAPEEDLTRVRI